MTITTSPVRVNLAEYSTATVECALPSPADREAADALAAAGDDAKLRVRWLIDGRAEISASSWVGVVRFSNLDIRVVPKLVGGELNVLRMIAFASGVDVLRRLPNLRALPPSGVGLSPVGVPLPCRGGGICCTAGIAARLPRR